jgi:hypothetical protein
MLVAKCHTNWTLERPKARVARAVGVTRPFEVNRTIEAKQRLGRVRLGIEELILRRVTILKIKHPDFL